MSIPAVPRLLLLALLLARPAAALDPLGQSPPGTSPRIFAPGWISTEQDELNSVFSPDGSLFLFSRKTPDRGGHVLMAIESRDDGWSPAATLPFSGCWPDADPAFSPDGRRLFFISQRPDPGEEPREDWDLFVVSRGPGGWGEPERLPAPLNTPAMEVHPSLAADGSLYFASAREGGLGSSDLYCARWENGVYREPENLGPAVNSEHGEGDLFVALDQSFLVFQSGRPGGLGRGDLWISRRDDDGSWGPATWLDGGINSDQVDYCPAVTPDGRFLFLTSYRGGPRPPFDPPHSPEGLAGLYRRVENGLGNIWWVDASVLGAGD